MEIIYETLNAEVTPEALAQMREKKVIFESASQHEMKGRYSMLAFDHQGKVTLDSHRLTVEYPDTIFSYGTDPYKKLKNLLNEYKAEIDDPVLADLPLVSGFVGSCSFDLVRHAFKKLQEIEIENTTDDLVFYMVESLYVFDHYKEKIHVITSNLFSNAGRKELEARLESMVGELKSVRLYHPVIDYDNKNREIETNITEADFMDTVSYFKSLIQKGDMFQAVPSRIYKYRHAFGHERNVLTFQLYKNLKRQNPSPYMYYLNFDDPIIVGSSPESFVKVEKGKVITNPIAGTIKRGRDAEEDSVNAELLSSDEKELSEHRMLVDLGRNDVNRVSEQGSVRLERLMEIEKYEHVMHIVSVVTGDVKKDISPIDVVTSLLPTGTVSGAPKLRAIERIYEVRPEKRGIYSGGVGYINCNQELDFALAIRTMLVDDEYVNVEAGCGVVYDSVPEKELEETKLKVKSLLEVHP
ncbi:anthranilate synthase component I [Salinicoccus halitifaciens]|uniref:Anthranilate synthase component 1 n=1 Tax=Salinicoccus halitifaciens TaxID=1073415 RepID=A0ABV2EA01_9STAP|nr:anthranilate synthase component I [Salinicoccus halitifaciens]MCD2138386.1 anthranilate synthase component I [Salinicoccus halitifaciens]